MHFAVCGLVFLLRSGSAHLNACSGSAHLTALLIHAVTPELFISSPEEEDRMMGSPACMHSAAPRCTCLRSMYYSPFCCRVSAAALPALYATPVHIFADTTNPHAVDDRCAAALLWFLRTHSSPRNRLPRTVPALPPPLPPRLTAFCCLRVAPCCSILPFSRRLLVIGSFIYLHTHHPAGLPARRRCAHTCTRIFAHMHLHTVVPDFGGILFGKFGFVLCAL